MYLLQEELHKKKGVLIIFLFNGIIFLQLIIRKLFLMES